MHTGGECGEMGECMQCQKLLEGVLVISARQRLGRSRFGPTGLAGAELAVYSVSEAWRPRGTRQRRPGGIMVYSTCSACGSAGVLCMSSK